MAKYFFWFSFSIVGFLLFPPFAFSEDHYTCRTDLFVLGNAQDAGKPQIANHNDAAWQDTALRRMASSIAVVDRKSGARYLFDATPDIKFQLYNLDRLSSSSGFRLDGIFITHAHIGHYLGLAQLGREAMGASSIAVFAMPEMTKFLTKNAPWSQLVKLENIALKPLHAGVVVELEKQVKITPFLVPHRDEFAETVGFRIQGPGKSIIYLPDIDSWEQWDAQGTHIEDIIAANDLLFLDATFFSGDELPGRDMTKIPHPTITHTMTRLKDLPIAEKKKIRFIHLNHSNPAHDQNSVPYNAIRQAGFKVSQIGDRHCLD